MKISRSMTQPSWIQGRGAITLVFAGIAAYCLLIGHACFSAYGAFSYGDFDLAVHTQSLRNILHVSLDSSILGIPFLGNHMVPILFLTAPVYAIFPSPLTLLCLQTLALALGGWAVFLLARQELSERWGVAFAFFYLLYPPLIFMNLYEFHPIALATTFLLFALLAWRRQQFHLFLTFLILSLCCQENVALIAIGFGILALLERKTARWVATPLLLGLGWLILTVGWLMPRLNHDIIMFNSLYSHFGATLPLALKAMVLHPLSALAFALQPGKIAFLITLLTPVAFLCLLRPLALLPLLPILAQRLLSARPSEASILYHYQAEFIPFIFLGAILGVRFLRQQRWGSLSRITPLLLGCTVTASFFLAGTHERIRGGSGTQLRLSQYDGLVQQKLLRSIPPEASVATTFRHLAPLSGRERLYSLHHIYSGRYTLSSVPYPTPSEIDWIILDTQDPLTFTTTGFYDPKGYLNLQKLLSSRSWEVAENLDGFIALRKTTDPSAKPLSWVRFIDPIPALQPSGTLTTAIQLVGYRLTPPDSKNNRTLSLYWIKNRQSGADYDVVVLLQDGANTCTKRLSPGHRVWPPQSWPTNQWIVSSHRIHCDTLSPTSLAPQLTAWWENIISPADHARVEIAAPAPALE